MNALRSIIDLKAVKNMSNLQTLVFSFLFGRKGRGFSADSIAEKIKGGLIPEDTKKEDLEKVTKGISKDIKEALIFLQKSGVIEPNVKEGKPVEGEYIMPSYNIEDLPEEKQIGIGEKVHTALTANPDYVYYKGDGILYMPHPLSPEFKSGIRVAVGELKSFHVNEEGFVYLIVLKAQKVDKDGKNLKREQCAVKASKAQLVDTKIPEAVTECVTYKKSAGLKPPAALSDTSTIDKGEKVLFFTNIWSPNAKHMTQIVDGLVKAKKIKGDLVVINTDHQVKDCAKYNIRISPTLIRVKDGKEISRIENMPKSEPNEEILKFVK